MATAFSNYLQAEVRGISQRERLSPDRAFLFWFAVTILELSDDDAREAISIEGSNDKGIDLFWAAMNERRNRCERRTIILTSSFRRKPESRHFLSCRIKSGMTDFGKTTDRCLTESKNLN
jgi:hypothetical protein